MLSWSETHSVHIHPRKFFKYVLTRLRALLLHSLCVRKEHLVDEGAYDFLEGAMMLEGDV